MSRRRALLLVLAGIALVVALATSAADAGPAPTGWRDIGVTDGVSLSALSISVVCGRRARSRTKAISA